MYDKEERKRWLEARQEGIGGSDVAGIMGVCDYNAPWDIYDSKVLPVEVEEEEARGILRRGNMLEAFAAQLFTEETGMKVRRQPMRAHREYPWMLGNIDRQIVGLEGGPRILEVKVPGVREFYRMKDEGLRANILLQIQHYLEVYDYSTAHFVIFNAEYWDHYTFEVARDRAVGKHLIEVEKRFWHDHVLARVRPTRPLPTPVPLPTKPGEAVVRDDDEWLFAADLYRQRQYEYEEAKNDLASAESMLADLAGEDNAVAGGEVKFERYATRSSRRFDSKAFVAEFRTRMAAGESVDDLDPTDDEWFYQTQPSEKTRVKVLTPYQAGIDMEVTV